MSIKLPMLCILLALVPLGCGKTDVGDDCDEVGDTSECVDNAICTNEGDNTNQGTCRWICSGDADCSVGSECNGVAGTNIKSCQPKK